MVKCKIRYDGGLIAWPSAKPTDWTPEVNYHISWIMAEISVLCGELRAPCCPGFLSIRSSCSTSLTSPTSLSQDYEHFFLKCPATIRSENMSEQAQGDLLQTQSQDDELARRRPLPPEFPWGKVNRKRIHTHFLKDRNCEMQEGQNYLDSTQETHRWSHTSSSKIWEKW